MQGVYDYFTGGSEFLKGKRYHYSPEAQRKLDRLGFKVSPYSFHWSGNAPERQQAIFIRKIQMAWITSLPVGLCIGFWLMTVKGGLDNALLFWAFIGVVALLRILYVVRGQGREKEGYYIAKRDIYQAISKGDTLAVYANAFPGGLASEAFPPYIYDKDLQKEEEDAGFNYSLLHYLGRTSGQGFDIKQNENFDVRSYKDRISEMQAQEKAIETEIRWLDRLIKGLSPWDTRSCREEWGKEKQEWEEKLEQIQKEKEAMSHEQ